VLQIESIPGDVHVLEGLTSHRYQDVPAAIETPGHRLDRDSTRVVWLDLHDLKLGSEIFESTAGGSHGLIWPSLVLINDCFQDLRKLPTIIAARWSPGAQLTAQG